jgi:hypothetical protein
LRTFAGPMAVVCGQFCGSATSAEQLRQRNCQSKSSILQMIRQGL